MTRPALPRQEVYRSAPDSASNGELRTRPGRTCRLCALNSSEASRKTRGRVATESATSLFGVITISRGAPSLILWCQSPIDIPSIAAGRVWDVRRLALPLAKIATKTKSPAMAGREASWTARVDAKWWSLRRTRLSDPPPYPEHLETVGAARDRTPIALHPIRGGRRTAAGSVRAL